MCKSTQLRGNETPEKHYRKQESYFTKIKIIEKKRKRKKLIKTIKKKKKIQTLKRKYMLQQKRL
jgi:hypothetical protein